MRSNFLLYIIFINVIFALELNVLTYNIHGLSPILAGDNPKDRIPEILNKSNRFDIILMQENWIFSDQEIAKYLDKHSVIVSNQSKFNNPIKYLLNPNGSGLSAAIKDSINILSHDEYSFKFCSGWLSKFNDCLATKGFQYISLQFDGERLDIYNTHLDAGEHHKDIEARIGQLKNLKEYINSHSSSYPLIIAGDMNINLLDMESRKLIEQFMIDLNLKMVNWSNELLDSRYALDYILYRGSDSVEIHLVNGGINKDLLGLSDHPPISGLFSISKK